ncbi:phage tail protein [Halobacillus massiliensis]|uniref:phage tail protein n=1 Tax=Halobacillus massiliensis TaxID=1926286 RepID=UPI0009E62D2C|nr:hypothetical protein [Halobacillus massiliensis]
MANYSVDAELKASVSKYRKAIQTARRVTEKFKRESESVEDTRLNANTSPLRRNLKKARQMMNRFARKKVKAEVDVEADTSEAKRKMGLLLAVKQALSRKVIIPIEARVNKFQRTISRIANSIQALGIVASNTFRGIGLMVSSGLVPILASLGGLIGGIGVQLGVVSGGALALASSMSAAAAGTGALIPFATSLGKELAELYENVTIGSSEFNGLSKATQNALKGIQSFKNAFEDLKDEVREPIFSAFAKYLEAGTHIIEKASPMVNALAHSFDDLGQSLLDNLNADDVKKNFDWIRYAAPGAFENWGRIIGNVTVALANLFRAFDPLAISVEQGLLRMTESFRQWTDSLSESKRFNNFIEYVKTNGPKLLSVIGNITVGLVEMFAGFGPMAADMMTRFQGMTKRFREWATTISENQSFQQFIAYVRENGPKVISLIGNIITFLKNLGVALAPLGSTILDVVNSFISWSNTMMEAHPIIGRIISALTVIVGSMIALVPIVAAARTAFAGLGGVLTNVVGKAFNFLRAPITSFRALIVQIGARVAPLAGTFLPLLRTALMALSGPVGIIIGVLSLLVPVFVRLWKENEAFRQGVQTAWSFIQQIFTTVISFIADFVRNIFGQLVSWWNANQQTFFATAQRIWNLVYNAVVTVLQTLWGFITQITSKIQQIWQKHGDGILRIAQFAWQEIVSIVSTLTSVLGTIISGSLSFLKGLFQITWPIISGVVQTAFSLITTIVEVGISLVMGILDTTMSLIKGDWDSAWQTVKDTASDIMDSIVSTFEGIDLVQIGKDIIQGLIDGIGSMFGGIRDMVKQAADLIPDWLKKKLGIASPSKVTTQLGKWTGEGMAKGTEKTLPLIAKKAKEMAQAVVPNKKDMTVDPSVQLKSSSIKSSLNSLRQNSKAQVLSAVNADVKVTNKQPAYINLGIAGREFNAFVEDITQTQDRQTRLKKNFQ